VIVRALVSAPEVRFNVWGLNEIFPPVIVVPLASTAVAARLTVPVNPSTGSTVTVVTLGAPPADCWNQEGSAESVKDGVCAPAASTVTVFVGVPEPQLHVGVT
jgi:hypothetical protein